MRRAIRTVRDMRDIMDAHKQGMQYLGEVAESAKYLTNGLQQYFGAPPVQRFPNQPQQLNGITDLYNGAVDWVSNDVIQTGADAYNGVVDFTSENIIPTVVTGATYAATAVPFILDPLGTAAGYAIDNSGVIVDAAGNAVHTVTDAAGRVYDSAGNAIATVGNIAQKAATTITTITIFAAIAVGLVIFGPEIRAAMSTLHHKE